MTIVALSAAVPCSHGRPPLSRFSDGWEGERRDRELDFAGSPFRSSRRRVIERLPRSRRRYNVEFTEIEGRWPRRGGVVIGCGFGGGAGWPRRGGGMAGLDEEGWLDAAGGCW